MVESLEYDTPSKARALWSQLVGRILISLVRYSWLPANDAAAEYGLELDQVFGRTAGPVALEFECGLVIAAGSEPSENSVIAWVEKDQRGTALRSEPLAGDSELYPISANDARYADAAWAVVCGQRVCAITVWRRIGQNLTRSDLPNEAGVEVELENGARFFLSHGLHDDSDDFSVLLPHEIAPNIYRDLRLVFRLDTPAN
jgi:hypothetical protein